MTESDGQGPVGGGASAVQGGWELPGAARHLSQSGGHHTSVHTGVRTCNIPSKFWELCYLRFLTIIYFTIQ